MPLDVYSQVVFRRRGGCICPLIELLEPVRLRAGNRSYRKADNWHFTVPPTCFTFSETLSNVHDAPLGAEMNGLHVAGNRGQVEMRGGVPYRRRFRQFLVPARGRGTPILVVLGCATLLVCAAAPVAAQTSWGGGVAFTGQDPLGPGLQASGYFTLPARPRLRLGTDFTYYRPVTDSVAFAGQSFDFRFRMWDLTANLHYLFVSQSALSVYGLGGASMSRLTSASLPTANAGRMTSTVPGLGANAGAGIELPLAFGALYGEGRYMVSAGQNRYTLGAGLRIRR